MKTSMLHKPAQASQSAARRKGFLALLGLLAVAIPCRATVDNFDGCTSASWQTSSTTGYSATFSYVQDVFGGNAFRLQAGVPATSDTPGQVNMARAIAVRNDQTYSAN